MGLTPEVMAQFRAATPDPTKVRVWIDALRSGTYTQCRGAYTEVNSHCCLAVLGEVHDSHGMPEEKLHRLLGLTEPSFGDVPLWISFADANDQDEWSYGQIADWLEEAIR